MTEKSEKEGKRGRAATVSAETMQNGYRVFVTNEDKMTLEQVSSQMGIAVDDLLEYNACTTPSCRDDETARGIEALLASRPGSRRARGDADG